MLFAASPITSRLYMIASSRIEFRSCFWPRSDSLIQSSILLIDSRMSSRYSLKSFGIDHLVHNPCLDSRLYRMGDHKVHIEPEKVLEKEAQPHEGIECVLFKLDEKVDIALRSLFVARE